MLNLPESLRALLKEKVNIGVLQLEKVEDSGDGETKKFLWKLSDNNFVESVLIMSGDRRTVCVSFGDSVRLLSMTKPKSIKKRNSSSPSSKDKPHAWSWWLPKPVYDFV